MPEDDFWAKEQQRESNRRGFFWVLVAVVVYFIARSFGFPGRSAGYT